MPQKIGSWEQFNGSDFIESLHERSDAERRAFLSGFTSSSGKTMIPKPPQTKEISRASFWGRVLDRIHQNQIVIAALILLLAVFIYCCATRYTSFRGGGVLDHWTGKVIDPD